MSDRRSESLTDAEFAALRGAAVWRAKYQASAIASEGPTESRSALAEREEFVHLVLALRKLGVAMPLPDVVRGDERAAA